MLYILMFGVKNKQFFPVYKMHPDELKRSTADRRVTLECSSDTGAC